MRKYLVVGLSYLAVIAWGCLPVLSNRTGVAVAKSDRVASAVQTTQARADKTSTPSSKRLKIEIEVTSPGDLLVKEGQTVAANQPIADRQSERSTLSAQLQETKLAIEKLKAAPQVDPLPPAGTKALTTPPPQSAYTEERAQITAAAAKLQDLERKYTLAQTAAQATLPETEKVRGSRIAIVQAQEKINRQQQKIDALKTVEESDEAVKDHELTKLRELNRTLIEAQTKLEQDLAAEGIAKASRSSQLADARFEITEAQRGLQLAKSRLVTAAEKHKQSEFDYQTKVAERDDRVQRTELERVKLQQTTQLQQHDRDYQLAQLTLKHNQIQKQLETIGVVRTPHQGTIRRVKLVSQHGHLLRYEVALVYTPTAPKPARLSSQQWQVEN
ncbi:hypothetical protein [Chamaesiphon polymorphus]|uniref:Membrane fusion protein biotin-lipoyl like domain-containing protein n=1 Tax=Chamaesiphon polymorphus CCALA 037 TaxID=2107692 RepID=A0A2T1FNV9_9CYAN|nr:hypothetical protein [Chamaesiphon polymorphus]PSB46621.1 hypothetical protein C7B77_24705 [Chamaesiphon polymorphus CCALA 037]